MRLNNWSTRAWVVGIPRHQKGYPREVDSGPMRARFAAVRARVVDGPPQRIGDKGTRHMPGEGVWLIGERRVSGKRNTIS
jgi:hypothetical protein